MSATSRRRQDNERQEHATAMDYGDGLRTCESEQRRERRDNKSPPYLRRAPFTCARGAKGVATRGWSISESGEVCHTAGVTGRRGWAAGMGQGGLWWGVLRDTQRGLGVGAEVSWEFAEKFSLLKGLLLREASQDNKGDFFFRLPTGRAGALPVACSARRQIPTGCWLCEIATNFPWAEERCRGLI